MDKVISSQILLPLFCLLSIWSGTSFADDLPTCQPKDYHYEYTECDSYGGRWRVSVPAPDKCNPNGTAPNAPVRGKACTFTCEAGKYLDLNGDQECHACPAGEYSLGGGAKFEDWTELPKGFSIETEEFAGALATDEEGNSATNCSQQGWKTRKDYIASVPKHCTSSLVYTANLVRAGSVSFTYQYADNGILFHFLVQNSQCQGYGDRDSSRWPSLTEDGQWRTQVFSLKSGPNTLVWKTIGLSSSEGTRKPILIKEIVLHGVAYTSQCSKCKEGTMSAEGSSSCTMCEPNTYAPKGSPECKNCDSTTEYSNAGAGACTKRPPCKEKDYFAYNMPCDEKKQTRKMYRWVEPTVCRIDDPTSVKLPTSGTPEPCPPCNPGMEYGKVNGTAGCIFCPKNSFSDGSKACEKCPANTAPNYSIEYKWWNNLPPNVTSSCLSMDDDGCRSKEGWVPTGDHIASGIGHADDSYLLLNLHISGFSGKEATINGKAAEIATLTFVFETKCQGKCEFFFMQFGSQMKSVGEWYGRTPTQSFSYAITKNEPVTFSWAFQKTDWESAYEGDKVLYKLSNDIAKIYSISVTNTIDGGATECRSCPKGTKDDQCVPCPAGQYIEPNSTQCKTCPANTIIQSDQPWGKEACHSCGQGLQAKDHQLCYSTCQYTDKAGRQYDFRQLNSPTVLAGARLFTSSGTQYYHTFNISLCGHEGLGEALCANNVTQSSDGTAESSKSDEAHGVQSMICRSTLIPPRMNEQGESISAQPVSLGDHLLNITNSSMKTELEAAGWTKDEYDLDLHFTYVSSESTKACPDGRYTVIHLRCDVKESGSGTLELPPKCPDGTCDGCTFHFMWNSKHACPQCHEDDYDVVKGECHQGEQIIHYYPPKHCVLMGDGKPVTKKMKCPILPFFAEVAIAGATLLAVLLITVLVYCWKRNRKLEYKYMKLAAGSGKPNIDGEMELPAAETCALSEDEEEQFDAVKFKESRGSKFMNKLKNITGKGGDNPFESIQLTDKTPLT
ncbi:unnamed protein product [Owenia fusiformis]|uniref:MRH domain-containing protein n=1 Tax=Owenia fusiformis TaxID=6347 RepID=A0A8S4NLU3_OWEFU|nr:unnamed protein product [Owenia fusiformis]